MDIQRASQERTTGRMGWAARVRVSQRWIALTILGAICLMPTLAFLNVSAADSFASPAFQQQWNTGEAAAPNFWGPLELARAGQPEPYVEAVGGMRTMQYFDKARMELGADNTVTNGLLATELITGNRQLGDTLFQNFGSAHIPVAGDPDNLGPTYAAIQSNAAQLRVVVTASPGAAVTVALTPAGALTTFANGASFPQANIGGYDGVTEHNVPAAFVSYRNMAGIPAIGLAISEPFWSNVKVAGQQRDVLMQAFERRVLTYTPANPEAFQVEFGNIGSHYHTWRYTGNTGGVTVAVGAVTPPVTATATVTATKMLTTAPVAPALSSFSLSSITPSKVTTAFTASVAACGTTEVRIQGNAAWTSNIAGLTCTPGTKFTVTLTSLVPNTLYEVRGAAKVGNGPVSYSAISTFTTLTAQPTVESYAWTWFNDDANTTGIYAFAITTKDDAPFINVAGLLSYDNTCTMSSPCYIARGGTTFTADPLSFILVQGKAQFVATAIGSEKLTMTFTDDTRTYLQVVEVRTPLSALGRVEFATYIFRRAYSS